MTVSTEVARRDAALPAKVEYARMLAASGLLPSQYRDKPANILYATEFGEMLGLAPMAAIMGIHVIEGKPSASAALISALVRRAGHRLRVSGDGHRAVAEIVRCDDPEWTFRAEWTIERARAAGLANKAVWKNYPAAMLKARAITEVARDACQEALSGLQYTPEELGVEVDAEGAPTQVAAEVVDRRPAAPDWASKPAAQHERATGQPAAAAAQDDDEAEDAGPEPDWTALLAEAERTGNVREVFALARQHRPGDLELREQIMQIGRSSRKAAPAAALAPDQGDVVDAELVDDPADDAPAGGVTRQQHAHMHALWAKAELSDRDERLAVTGLLIGRYVESSSDLSAAEADIVIGSLRDADSSPSALYQQVSAWVRQAAAAEDGEAAAS